MQKLKTGDTVVITNGRDKGKSGKIVLVNRKKKTVIVEKVNMVKKHKKATQNTKAGIIETPSPVSSSKVKLICPETGKPSRVAVCFVAGKKKRKAKISSAIFD